MGVTQTGMNVMMVTDFYWPFLGGVEQHVRSLAHELADRGHRVTVATLDPGDLPAEEADGSVEVVRVTTATQRSRRLFRQSRPWAPPIHDPVATRSLHRLIDERRPDVVHGHDWLARSVLGRTAQRPFVSTLHYYTLSCAKKDLMRSGRPCDGPAVVKCARCAAAHYGAAKGLVTASANALGAAIERRTATDFIAVSHATATGNGLDPADDHVHVIPNFLDGSGRSTVDDSSARLALLPTEPFFLYVGDFRPTKGFDVLIEAYGRLRTSRPLVVIGKRWPSHPVVTPEGVVVLEEWPHDAVLAAFARARAAIVPSVWAEPFGLVAIEAMSTGTPVIASATGGLVDIVTDLVDGRLVAPDSVSELAAAMTALDRDDQLHARLAAGAESSARRYTADVVVPQIEAVYRTALERNG